VNTSRGQNVTVVPIAVLIDDHFRSGAARSPRPKLNELTAPLKASQKALISQGALEQSARAVFTGRVPGALNVNGQRWFVIAPTQRPQVAAPLGWSLSQSARQSLNCQVPMQMIDPQPVGCPTSSTTPGDRVDTLIERLRGDG
jgi:hypothetical protein